MYKSIAKRYGAPSNAKPLKRNLKPVPEGNKGLGKLPEPVRNKMGFMRMKDGSEAPGGPFPRFCGGKSKPFKRTGSSEKVARQNYKPSEEDKANYAAYKQSGGKGDIYQAYRVGFRSPEESKERLSSTGTGQYGGVASRA